MRNLAAIKYSCGQSLGGIPSSESAVGCFINEPVAQLHSFWEFPPAAVTPESEEKD